MFEVGFGEPVIPRATRRELVVGVVVLGLSIGSVFLLSHLPRQTPSLIQPLLPGLRGCLWMIAMVMVLSRFRATAKVLKFYGQVLGVVFFFWEAPILCKALSPKHPWLASALHWLYVAIVWYGDLCWGIVFVLVLIDLWRNRDGSGRNLSLRITDSQP